jgi:hypothetical protein
MGCRRHRDTRGKTNVICVFDPHVLLNAGRFGSRERQRVVFPRASKYHDTLVSSPRPFERWMFSVPANVSEETHHHSLALAATRQINV